MNILFITLLDIRSVDEHNIYADLMREFARKGHNVFIVSPVERRHGLQTQMITDDNPQYGTVRILKLRTGNIQKTNIIEKGISTVLLEYQMLWGIQKYLKDIPLDLVIYSTPPITLVRPIRYVKKHHGTRTYLLLKDIFPQNAIDLNMMTKGGLKGALYSFFRNKEKALYRISDSIGCMSQANAEYILRNNPQIPSHKVEVAPNAIEIQDVTVTREQRTEIREKYGIPLDKKVLVYGGNLGKPQGIPFICQCLQSQKDNSDVFFLVVGDGTEYGALEKWVAEHKPGNMKLMQRLPKDDYDKMIGACDVGLIFLDHRFTIPNFPSRLLAYMQAKLPVLACTDENTDIGKIIETGGFGWWCPSNSTAKFDEKIAQLCGADLADMGRRGLQYLEDNYTVDQLADIILCER